MRFEHFRSMVERLAADIPEQYLAGVAAIDVSPKTIPHPLDAHVYTLGECIPIDTGTDEIQSHVVLYHGSFRELAAERAGFDWRHEAWDTLLHELRHHVEWRARSEELEAYDWAVEHNFARAAGRPFDPVFYQSGERVAEGVFRLDDDVFIEQVVRERPAVAEFVWHGGAYRVAVPSRPLPLYLLLDGLDHPTSGDVVLVLRRKPRLRDLFRGAPPVTQEHARVESAE
ncbi:MAG: metallopeptidase family protein [Gemmatimonadota bacterium]|nr:MAG: metallopeptidase family protein [Gemmatimonadota bacterium]